MKFNYTDLAKYRFKQYNLPYKKPMILRKGGITDATKRLIPGYGTYLDVKDAINDPSTRNIANALISGVSDLALVGGIGFLGKAAKLGRAAKAVREAQAAAAVTDLGQTIGLDTASQAAAKAMMKGAKYEPFIKKVGGVEVAEAASQTGKDISQGLTTGQQVLRHKRMGDGR